MSHLEQQFRVAELEVNRSTMDEKIVGVFRYESDTKGKRGPIILILAEIASTLYVYEQLLDALNEKAEQVRHLSAGVDADPMARFEKLVQGLNDGIANFLAHEPTPIAWNRVNMYVLQLWDGHLCLTGMGRLTNIFLQKQKSGTYKSFDLFGSLEQPAEVNPEKPFSSLICGDMSSGDMLFVGTTNFERLRHELGIADILTGFPPVNAALEIRQELERRDIPDDFAGVVIANVELQTKTAAVPLAEPTDAETLPKSTQSIEKMHREEQETQAVLSPSIAPLPKKSAEEREREVTVKERLANIWKLGRIAIRERMAKRTHLNRDPMALASLRGMNAGHGSTLSLKKRWPVIGAALLVVLGITGTLWFQYAKKASAEQALWNSVYDTAADKKNKAEGDLVYGNEDGARRLLEEASTAVNGLDEKNADRKRAKENLTAELQDLRNRLKREIRVDQIQPLFALAAEAAPDSLKTLTFTAKGLLTVDTGAGSIVQINPLNKQAKRTDLPSGKTVVASTPNTEKSNAFFLTDDQGLYVLGSGSSTFPNVTFTAKATRPVAIKTYNRRLYVLDPGGSMIWRHNASGSGFGQGSAYLQQTSRNFANATDLAIDSSVYVSFSDGNLARFLSGAEEAWSPATIDPPLKNAVSLWTDPDTDRVVVADHDGKRIVVLRKDGKLVGQIVSTAFTGPSAITGDAKERKLYILDGNQIFVTDLP